MFLGEFEQIVLLAVLQLGDEAYGVTVRREVESSVDQDIARGGLYTTLDRLEEKGLLTSRVGGSTREHKGKPKRFFYVTPQGISALRKSRSVLLKLWSGIETRLGESR